MGELDLIAGFVAALPRAGGDLLIAAGEDDAAAWRDGGSVTVASCDASVEGVHFDLAWMSPEDAGWRAVTLALGDLAAKGATPTYGLACLGIDAGRRELAQPLFGGIAAAAGRCGLKLVGGDTVRSPVLSIALTVLGRAANDPLPRSAVRPGWLIAVTGRLGAAAAGLSAAMAGEPLREEWEAALRRPLPRLREGAALAAAGAVCGDISDGLLRELVKFRSAAGCGAAIRAADVPVAAGCTLDGALTSGEEVELVCCGPEPVLNRARAAGIQLTVVGELTGGDAIRMLDPRGRDLPLPPSLGYDHFG